MTQAELLTALLTFLGIVVAVVVGLSHHLRSQIEGLRNQVNGHATTLTEQQAQLQEIKEAYLKRAEFESYLTNLDRRIAQDSAHLREVIELKIDNGFAHLHQLLHPKLNREKP
ncbi:hypothetical protein [Ferrimonas senticii]|uniref:hypothetical protein n=1 Tax=Ferrimonas senticii TaxID=394566 RepID=UPI00041CEA74|nr:hypothetical protein [Ferrimonas senticii]